MAQDDARPILVQFENGILKPTKRSSTKFKYLRSKVPKSTKRMLAYGGRPAIKVTVQNVDVKVRLADTGVLTYTGTVIHKQNGPIKYYLGLVDRENNVIEDIDMCQICTLKPNITEQLSTAEDSKKDVEKTFRQKSDNLVEAFGSAKQKRLLSSRKKNEGVHENAADKVADIANKIISQSPTSSPEATMTKKPEDILIIPPQNMSAKRVQDIYHVDDIISFQEYQLLKTQAQEFITLDNKTLLAWQNEKKYPEYILHHLSKLPMSSAEREEMACYLCFLNYLMIIFKLTYKEVQKRDLLPHIPNPLKSILLDRFTYSENGKHRCVPKKYKDKALCYILVLSLIIEEYEMKCNLLMKDLALGVARMTKLLRAIGCTVRTSNTRSTKTEDGTPVPANPTVTASLTMSFIKIKAKEETEASTPAKKIAKPEEATDIALTPVKKVSSPSKKVSASAKKTPKPTSVRKQSPQKKKTTVLDTPVVIKKENMLLKQEPMETD